MAKQLSEKQKAVYKRLKESGHYTKIGKAGGSTTKRRKLAENPNYYAEIGLKGVETMVKLLGGPEKAREYYSSLGSIKKGEGKGARS